MVTEIVIRHFMPEMEFLHQRISDLVRAETDFVVSDIDHSTLTLADFHVGHAFVVSIDYHLAEKFEVAYMQHSRLFHADGRVYGRKIAFPYFDETDICVIDTDMVEGKTIQSACQLLGTEKYSVPLRLEKHQDLIDIEDLVYPQSLLADGGMCRYIHNEEFFTRRTSLPRELFAPVRELAVSRGRQAA